MRSDLRYIAMSLLAAGVGAGLVYAGMTNGGAVWVSAGIGFMAIGAGTLLLTIAPALPGPIGGLLRAPLTGILIAAGIVILMVVTVLFGIAGSIR